MTNDERNPKLECRKLSVVRSPVSSFEFQHSFGFRHSSFGFENCSLFNPKAGQRTGESGRGWVGSRRASDRSTVTPFAYPGDFPVNPNLIGAPPPAKTTRDGRLHT